MLPDGRTTRAGSWMRRRHVRDEDRRWAPQDCTNTKPGGRCDSRRRTARVRQPDAGARHARGPVLAKKWGRRWFALTALSIRRSAARQATWSQCPASSRRIGPLQRPNAALRDHTVCPGHTVRRRRTQLRGRLVGPGPGGVSPRTKPTSDPSRGSNREDVQKASCRWSDVRPMDMARDDERSGEWVLVRRDVRDGRLGTLESTQTPDW